MAIKKPQKAPSESITNDELDEVLRNNSHVLGSPKLDGFRCTCNEAAYASSMKLIQNEYVQSILSDPAYAGLDGELLVGRPDDPDAFDNTSGAVRRKTGEPDFKLYVYDSFHQSHLSYADRTAGLKELCKSLPFAVFVNQTVLISVREVIAFEDAMVKAGYEGAMVRLPHAPYKEGRCTLREENIFKRKPFDDDECVILGFEEQMQNNNEKTTNELGDSTRSSHKANKTGKGTLGKFLVRSDKWGVDFAIATGQGLDDALRQVIWDNQDHYLGKIITYKYQRHGSKAAPRIPIYKGFRDPIDMTNY